VSSAPVASPTPIICVTIAGNTFVGDGVRLGAAVASQVTSHTLTGNTVNGKPLLFYKDCAGLTLDGVPVGQLLVANCTGVRLANLTVTDTDAGIQLSFVDDVRVTGSVVASNDLEGMVLWHAGNATIAFNNVSWSNNSRFTGWGVFLYAATNSTVLYNTLLGNRQGVRLEVSSGVTIHHNQLLANAEQGYEAGSSGIAWDDGYPGGGNFWSDYGGGDNCSGPAQNVCPDPDGLGDTPRWVFGNRDRYPLMTPPSPPGDPPVAVAVVSPPSGFLGTAFTFNASGSSDDYGIVSYLWDFGDGATATGAVATHSYAIRGNFTATLTVGDAAGQNDTDLVVVTVENRAPTADAGTDTTVVVGRLAALDGGGSSDPDGDALEYQWTQESGPSASLTGADTATPTFVPPSAGAYVFRLNVSDGFGGTSEDTVTLTAVENQPPVLVVDPAGPTIDLRLGEARRFFANATDPEDDPLTFTWMVDGTVVGSGASFEYEPANTGTYALNVTVSDGDLSTSWEWTVNVSVVEGDGPSSFPWWILLVLVAVVVGVLALFVMVRQRKRRQPPTA